MAPGAVRPDADDPGVGLHGAGHALDERALAGAVGPEQGVDLAVGDLQVDGVHHRDAAVRLAQPTDVEPHQPSAQLRSVMYFCRRSGVSLVTSSSGTW